MLFPENPARCFLRPGFAIRSIPRRGRRFREEASHLGVEPTLKNDLGGDLIDDGFLISGVSAGLLKRSLRGDGGKAFVPRNDLQCREGSEFLDELLCLGRGGAVGAIHISWHANNDGGDSPAGGELEDSGDRIAFGGGNGFEWVGEHSEVVAGRHTDACISKIYAECLFH